MIAIERYKFEANPSKVSVQSQLTENKNRGCTKNRSVVRANTKFGNVLLENVSEFRYLCRVITANNKYLPEVENKKSDAKTRLSE